MSQVHSVPVWGAAPACQGQAAARYFYPPASFDEISDERREREGAARALCARCRVRAACLEYALSVPEPYGIWGGLTEVQRRRQLRYRAEGVPASAR